MGPGLQKAAASARATQPLTREQMEFLRLLARWTGAATSRELGPQTSQLENSARQRCKRLGLVTYDGYWRLTEAGRDAIKSGVA